MHESKEFQARIGMVNFLNTAPIHEKWKETVTNKEWELVEASPAVLNKKIRGAQIDLGFISTIEYGEHPELYKILSGLSVSTAGPAGSVFLFSHIPLDQLNKEPVLLSSKSETCIGLAKIILEEVNSVHPAYSTGDVIEDQHEGYKAILAIGDDAVRLFEEAQYLYLYDLGDMWKRETGLPFVYSICAVREDFCEKEPELLSEIHRELLRCRDEGTADLEAICELSASRVPLTKAKCTEYLQSIEYDFNPEKRMALEKFFEFLVKRGDVQSIDLPLKIYSNLF